MTDVSLYMQLTNKCPTCFNIDFQLLLSEWTTMAWTIIPLQHSPETPNNL